MYLIKLEIQVAATEPQNWQQNQLREWGKEQPKVFSWVDLQLLWDNWDFRPNCCLLSAFLGRYKKRLEARRKTPNPVLTYEGLWSLAKPGQPFPAGDESWEACWNDTKVRLCCWHLPSIAIDIIGNVLEKISTGENIRYLRFEICRYATQQSCQ